MNLIIVFVMLIAGAVNVNAEAPKWKMAHQFYQTIDGTVFRYHENPEFNNIWVVTKSEEGHMVEKLTGTQWFRVTKEI